jgi:hypothetical protein
MKRDALDDVINRVAREITAVPPAAAIGPRLRERLRPARRNGPHFWRLAAVAVAVAIVAVASGRRTPLTEPSPPVSSLAAARPLSLVIPMRPAIHPEPARAAAPAARRLPPPPALAHAAPLVVEPLDFVTLPDLAPLAVRHIDVPALDTADMKEMSR